MNVSNFAELFALLVSLILIKHLRKHPYFIYFVPFLAITYIVEIYAINKDRSLKYILYNYFFAFEFFFYSFIFYQNLELPNLKKLVKLLFLIYIISFTANQLFGQGVYEYNRYTYILGSFIMVCFVCFLFYETILPKTLHKNLLQRPIFWVATGLLFFYLGTVIMHAMIQFLTNSELEKRAIPIFQFIVHSLNVILYGSFSLAFIICRHKTTSSPQL